MFYDRDLVFCLGRCKIELGFVLLGCVYNFFFSFKFNIKEIFVCRLFVYFRLLINKLLILIIKGWYFFK